MAWKNIHRTIGGNGQITVETGYYEETINLLNWSDAANNGKSAYTSPIPVSADKYMTVLMYFSDDVTGDTKIHVEQSHDGTTWIGAAQSGTTAMSTADFTGGTNISVLAMIDDGSQTENTTGYYFIYDPETHGSSRYVRFGFADNGAANDSGETVTWRIFPH
jgi:hypothetical protein